MLHSIWLVAGPSLEGVAWFLSSVCSLTTDMGVERGLCDMGNLLPLFAEHVGIECPASLAKSPYLFPNAIFIPGWNHIFSNLLKDGLSSLSVWPAMLERLRSFCTFFKTADYRETWQRHLGDKGIECKVLDSFSAGFAKWRWQTIYTVLRQIRRLSDLCQNHFDASLWKNVQDQRHLHTVEGCCNDRSFWVWVEVFYTIAEVLEEARVWGCVCRCHEAELLGGATLECKMKSRRLHEAGPRVQGLAKNMLQKATMMTLTDCGGDEQVLSDAVFVLRKIAGLLVQKFEFLDTVPWLFARADEPQQAEACLQQWESVPQEKHHRVTVAIMQKFKKDIDMVVAGCAPSPDLQVY